MNEDDRRMRETFRTVFGTVHGQRALKDLREQFYDRTLCVGDQHNVIINAAQRDVVRYIIDMIGGIDE